MCCTQGYSSNGLDVGLAWCIPGSVEDRVLESSGPEVLVPPTPPQKRQMPQ